MNTELKRQPEERRLLDDSPRVSALLEIVQSYASLDFTRRAELGEKGDDLDALALGINMLGEELEAVHEELEARVAFRTEELSSLADDLKAEVAERRQNAEALRESNQSLRYSVERLEQLNREIEKLTELSNLLQVCSNKNEAFMVLAEIGPELFAGTHGDIYIFLQSRDMLKRVASWGGDGQSARTVPPQDCWALRRGRLHRSTHEGGLRCMHLPDGWKGDALCVPLVAQGETIGMLHLRVKATDETMPDDASLSILHKTADTYAKLAVAASEQIALALANLELKAALEAQSVRDPLTNLHNRRYMDETLARELSSARRAGDSVSLLMLDVDHFKKFNDTYGHDAGDAALKSVAGILHKAVRAEDVVCRYGGEEFAIIMYSASAEHAARRGEDIRSAMEQADFSWEGQGTGSITLSAGVATFQGNARSASALIRAADQALYKAKEEGRNRVVISEAVPAEEPPKQTKE